MNLKVVGTNIEVTPAIREYIEKKLERIDRHADNIISTTVTLSIDNKFKHKSEVDTHLAGKTLHAESIEDDMYASIDILVDKLDRMLIKHKEKNTTHRAIPSGRESVQQID